MSKTKTLYNLFIFLLVFNIDNIACANFGPIRNAVWPYIDSIPFPYPTKDPINITLSQALPVFTPFPLQFNNNPLQRQTITNTGSNLVVTTSLSQFGSSQRQLISLTGGVLFNDRYIFFLGEFFWDNSLSGGAGNYINGQGASLISVSSYYNTKYGSPNNAKSKRDGIAQVAYQVNVLEGIDNPLFYSFQSVLQQVLKAGSSTSYLQFLQFFSSSICSYYYAYPGDFQDVNSGKVFYSSTFITLILTPPTFISVRQFKATFGSLKNKAGKPYSHITKVFPKGQRPLRVALGCM